MVNFGHKLKVLGAQFQHAIYVLFISVFSIGYAPDSLADWKLNMPRGVTSISKDIYDLHMTIFWICVAIGVVVFGVMMYALVMHRKSRGVKAAEFHEHPVLEIIWAIVPFIILVAMAIPATRVLIAMNDSSEADVTIKVTGYQWKWQYDYLDENIGFFSNLSTPIEQIKNQQQKNPWYLLEVDNPIVVPIHKKIRFLVTANDVIHSWWVPELGIKRDGIPGFIHESWARIEKPGIYRGQCAELCGVNHAYMPIVVKAVAEEEYVEWVNQQRQAALEKEMASAEPWTFEKLMEQGKSIYDKACVACHKDNGEGMPPVFPALKGSSVTVGENIERHIEMVLYGVEGTAMQAFGKQLSDADIAAVVTYERNAWGNDRTQAAGEKFKMVQPVDVKKIRLKK